MQLHGKWLHHKHAHGFQLIDLRKVIGGKYLVLADDELSVVVEAEEDDICPTPVASLTTDRATRLKKL